MKLLYLDMRRETRCEGWVASPCMLGSSSAKTKAPKVEGEELAVLHVHAAAFSSTEGVAYLRLDAYLPKMSPPSTQPIASSITVRLAFWIPEVNSFSIPTLRWNLSFLITDWKLYRVCSL